MRTLRRFSALILLLNSIAVTAHADWQYDYYEGTWTSLPNFSALTPVASGNVSTVSTAPAQRADNYALRFQNQVTVDTAGNYLFSTNSDDGSELLIDGTVVVDNDGLHGANTVTGSVFLSVGTHDIEVTHFERTGGALLETSYAPPGGAMQGIPADGQLEGPPNIAEVGNWGPVISWPHVPVSAANLPDGRILTWASNERYSFPGNAPEFTFTAVWNPENGNLTEIDHPTHDMFCAHQVMLEDGKVFVAGGRNQGDSPWTSVFDSETNEWIPLNNMNRGRWYPTSLALPDGSVFTAIGSGGGNTGEVYHPDTGDWTILSGIDFNPMILDYWVGDYGENNWWPLFMLAPDGSVFHGGPTPQMHVIDTSGVGSATPVGSEFNDWYPKHGTTVMYAEGKLITAGGWQDGSTLASTNEALTVDLNGPTPVVSPAAPMVHPRKFHNGVMLPDGEVLVVGGNTSGQKFNDSGTVYAAEIWNPESGVWREVAGMSVPRNYHSIALLLTDGRVLSAGGGLCACSADHPDGQVYSPPYLFNADGSPATRPVIESAPAVIRAGDTFDVAADSEISHFSLIKMSSTTHAINTDLRYLEVPFDGTAGVYQLDADPNPNVLTPGYWMLFALDADGTPSESHVLQVQSENEGEPDAVSGLDFTYNSFADASAFQLNGTAASVGGDLRLTTDSAGQAGTAFYRTPVEISLTTSFNTSFEFSVSGTANGGEGLAFVVQGNASTALGANGSGLGYESVANSLIVEVDNAANAAGDVDGNHVAVHVGGDAGAALGSVSAPFDLEDGGTHKLWLDYDAAEDELAVYLSADAGAARPSQPALTVGSLDLVSLVGSRGYFGFSAATGTLTNTHDIEAWAINVTTGSDPLVINDTETPPQPSDGPVDFSASASGEGLEYSWSFGDGTAQTPFSASPDTTHTYDQPGRYVVTLIVRDANGVEQTRQFVQAVYPPLTPNPPTASNSLVVESQTGAERVWNVNPDNDTVTVINGGTGAQIGEIGVGKDPRSLALAPDGTIWVANKDDASISIIDTGSLAVVGSRSLPHGARPHGIVMDWVQGSAYVALESLESIWKLDVYSDTVLATVAVGSRPRHLSLTGDGSRLFVSRFITPPLPDEHTTEPKTTAGGEPAGGEVVAVDTGSMTTDGTIVLGYSSHQASELSGPGFPNYLGPAIVTPGGLEAWVPSKQDNIPRGTSRSGAPLNFEHTVRAVTSVIDLGTETEDTAGRIDHDNASIASNGAFGPYGVYLFVALEGNREVAVVDPFAREEILRFDVGIAPQAVTVSPGGRRAYVHNFMTRSVTVVDIADLINGLSESVSVIATIDTTAGEKLTAQVLRGKQLFYDARDPRLARDSYMACASCHNDGGQDGRVWDLTNLGEGLRNTISLKGHAGMGHGPLHWSANFDEVQDFENQIRELAGGTGLMSDADFAATQDVLGPPKAGRSADLDALAAYLASLTASEPSPYRAPDGGLTSEGEAGKALFESAACADCHTGNPFTDSAPGVNHDIGTITGASGQRLGEPLTSLDTPTLKNLWATAPYLHDGSAPTLRDAVLAHDAASLGGVTFTDPELDSLVSYLRQIDDSETVGTPPQPTTVIRVNAGGPDYTDGNGDLWSADTGFNTGSLWSNGGAIDATTDDTLYQTERWDPNDGTELEYTFSVPNGEYTVNLLFADIASNTWGVNARVFDIAIEGALVEDNLDIFAEVGAMTAMTRSYTVSVSDGALNIAFGHEVEDPKISAIEILGGGVTAPSVTLTSPTPSATLLGSEVTVDYALGGDQSAYHHLHLTLDGNPYLDVNTLTGSYTLNDVPAGSHTLLAELVDASHEPLTGAEAADSVSFTVELPVAVPDVVGLAQAAAESAIDGAGLTVGAVTTTASSTVPAGDVISQSPASGTQVAPGSGVDLVVSSGPAPVTVPDVVGLTQAAAETAILNADLAVGTVTTSASASIPAGSVISQSPAGGGSLAPGSSVDLVVSSGPAQVTVPAVVGLSQAAAETAIANAGLAAGAISTATSSTVPAGDVISQSPTSGTLVNEGSAVDLVISLGPQSVSVPGVTGLSQAAAESAIVGAGLTTGAVTTASSDTVPAGTVISQSPSAGSNVAEGSAVDLVVSSGPVEVTVPGVVGLEQSAAEDAITSAGLVVGTVTTSTSATVPTGDVISQSPTGGTVVNEGSAVNLVVSVGETPPAETVIRVNAGGPDYTDGNGDLWSADTGFNTGSLWSNGGAIDATTDDTLYQTERWDPNDGTELEYTFSVPNGEYTVNLLFADIASNTWRVNGRVFDIAIEGALVEDNLDIFAEVGAMTAMTRSYAVSVSDGALNIAFGHEVEDPKISAIEILGGGVTAPSVTLTSPTPSATLLGSEVTVDYALGGDQSAYHHLHLTLDGNPYLDVNSLTGSYTLNDVPAGNHTLLAELVDASHEPLTEPEAADSVSFTVELPVAVPDVVGLEQVAAESAIDNAGLTVGAITTTASSTVPAGDVISQSPASGTQVAPGSGVDLVVSSGPAPVTVPDVVGLTQAAAETAILNADLAVGTVTTSASASIPAGSVISQSPTGGNSLAPGSSVDLVVSEGPVQVTVPDVVGLGQAAAESAVTSASLTVGNVTTSTSATVPAGDVISQSPAGGVTTDEGSAVDLVISLGPESVSVPSVVGLSQAAAESSILAAGLEVGTVTSASSTTVPAGDVVSQNPAGGTSVSEGSTVDLVVSTGPVQVTVPDVTGLAQSAAEDAIAGSGLVVGAVTSQNSDTVSAGNVISQNPAGGGTVNEGTAVDLVVSAGPVQVSVPDVTGLSQVSAESAITGAGLTVGAVTSANSDTVPAGDVISQNPAAGSSVDEGSAVDLAVSIGPIEVTVPEVTGLTQAAAETAITGAGLTVGTVTTSTSTTVPAGDVISQSPAAGSVVNEGSAVNLVVSVGETPPAATVIRINAGGPDYTDGSGNLWSADTGFNTGSLWWNYGAVAGTTDDALYQTERWDPNDGTELEYTFSVPNGEYTVNLLFADIAPNTWRINGRVFDIAIEGALVEDNLDIFAEVGAMTAMTRSYTVSVTDGALNIAFGHQVEDPKISAIEILQH